MKTTRYVFVFLMMCISSVLLAQEQEIRGKVTSAEDGSAIFGANIQEKGSVNGTTTDINGEFKLKVKKDAVLMVSYIGFIKREVEVAEQNYLNIALTPSAVQVKEVEVVGIGYGEVKKSDATGSVTAVSSKDFRFLNAKQEQIFHSADEAMRLAPHRQALSVRPLQIVFHAPFLQGPPRRVQPKTKPFSPLFP